MLHVGLHLLEKHHAAVGLADEARGPDQVVEVEAHLVVALRAVEIAHAVVEAGGQFAIALVLGDAEAVEIALHRGRIEPLVVELVAGLQQACGSGLVAAIALSALGKPQGGAPNDKRVYDVDDLLGHGPSALWTQN